MSELLFTLAFAFYAVGLFHSVAWYRSRKDLFYKIGIASQIVAFALHTLFLVLAGVERGHFPLTHLRESLAFFAWAVSLCFLIAYGRFGIKAVGVFALPVIALLLLATTFFKTSPAPEILRSTWIYWHTTCLFLAYAMFFVVFVASLLYLFQQREIKRRGPHLFERGRPSLLVLDEVFEKFLIAGFCFMTLGLLAGVVWAEEQWLAGWQKDPKVISAFMTWLIYLVLLSLRLSAGWRGRRAAVMSVAGFLSVLFTFLGTRLFLGGLHSF